MRLLLIILFSFAPLYLLSQKIISFYGGKDQQRVIIPSLVISAGKSINPYTQYSIDINFSRLPVSISTDSLDCIFTTQKGAINFKLSAEWIVNLKAEEKHHFIFSRKGNSITLYFDNIPVHSLYDPDNLFDLRFPWFDLEFFIKGIKVDLFKTHNLLITGKPFEGPISIPAQKKETTAIVSVFPNPAINSHYISPANPDVTKIIICTPDGKSIMEIRPGNNKSMITVSINSLLPGPYMLQLFNARQIISTKLFIKQ